MRMQNAKNTPDHCVFMQSSTTPVWAVGIALLMIAILDPGFGTGKSVLATEFVVQTTVYRHPSDTPLFRNTTYFSKEIICDITHPKDPEDQRMLVIDRGEGTAALCRVKDNQACVVSLDEVLRTVAAISTRTNNAPRLVQFAASPQFDVAWKSGENRLDMSAEPLSYTVDCEDPESIPADAKAVAQYYREFADWSARLNTTTAGGLPPMARLRVNQELVEHVRIPNHVTVSKRTDQGDLIQLSSRHAYRWQLDSSDHAEIQQCRAQIRQCDLVDLRTLQFGDRSAQSGKQPPDQSR